MINTLEGANSPHYFEDKEELLYTYSKYFQDLLQSIFADFLTVELGWNFVNNSPWFLESIQNYVEFVSPLLEQLKQRAILPFLAAFGLVGTYAGFGQVCVGLFGDDVVIEYIDGTHTINISNITSSIKYLFVAEGRGDFNFVTEDELDAFITEDVFIPPSGLSTIKIILSKFLPAEQFEITTINFVI